MTEKLTEQEKKAYERSIDRFEIVCEELSELLVVCDSSNYAAYKRQLEEKTDILVMLRAELRILNG